MTRRYLLYIVLTLTCGLAIYMFILTESAHNHEQSKQITLSNKFVVGPISGLHWEDYRRDCGFNSFVKDPQRAIAKFDRIYQNMGVSWDGYVIRVSLNEEDAINFAYHSSNIMIKMEPEDQAGGHGADLGLSLSEKVLA